MKILRTRENGRPHSRAKEKLRSLTLRYLFLCLSRSLSLAASSSLSPPAFCLRVSRPLSFAALRHRQLRSCTPTELHGRHGWAQGLIPPPLSVRRGRGGGRCAPCLHQGAAARLSGQKLVFSPATCLHPRRLLLLLLLLYLHLLRDFVVFGTLRDHSPASNFSSLCRSSFLSKRRRKVSQDLVSLVSRLSLSLATILKMPFRDKNR